MTYLTFLSYLEYLGSSLSPFPSPVPSFSFCFKAFAFTVFFSPLELCSWDKFLMVKEYGHFYRYL